MICPMTSRRTTPATCLFCAHFGGFQGGVVCYYANRRIPYHPALQVLLNEDRANGKVRTPSEAPAKRSQGAANKRAG